MTPQGQLSEPSSPKLMVSAPKKCTKPKSKQKKFNRRFPTVDDDETVLNHYSCALIGDILLQGHLYMTKKHFAFYSNVFGYVTKLLIPVMSVRKITKERTARIIPNAVGVETSADKHVFGSLMSRDSTYRYMIRVWEAAKLAINCVESESMTEIPASETSNSSDEGDVDSDKELEEYSNSIDQSNDLGFELLNQPPYTSEHAIVAITSTRHSYFGVLETLWNSYSLFLPANIGFYISATVLTTLLLTTIILFYRIIVIEDRYLHTLPINIDLSSDEDVYRYVLQLQKLLHLKSVSAVRNLIHLSEYQLAALRKSLEALTTLLALHATNIDVQAHNNGNSHTDEIDSLKSNA